MKKAIKWIVGLLVLAAIAGDAWFFFKPQDKTAYITEPVKRDTISQTVSATGEIMASQMVDVGAQASGQIKKLHVELGQLVKKGDLIAEIDSTASFAPFLPGALTLRLILPFQSLYNYNALHQCKQCIGRISS